LVSALGFDWRAACSAARAGLRRASPIDGYEAASAVDGEAEPVFGHACPMVTEGFEGSARLLSLLTAGLAALLEQSPALAHCGSETGFLLVLGARERLAGAQALIEFGGPAAADEPAQPLDQDDPPPPVIETDRAALLARAAHAAGFSREPRLLRCWEDDDTSAVVAMESARRWLAEGRIARAVVIAADSLLEPDTVAWLENTGRLKAAGMPSGLEPGEACAAVVLQPDAEGLTRMGWVVDCAFAIEPSPLLEGKASSGSGTGQALRDLATRQSWARDGAAWIISDHNGEAYRANDLSLALVRTRAQAPALADTRLDYPAAHFGDTGAVRSVLALCTALAAFERGYAPSRQACVLAASEGPRRSAMLVTGP
jgi:hypothetical protein